MTFFFICHDRTTFIPASCRTVCAEVEDSALSTVFCPLNNCSLQIPGSHTELSPDSEGAEAVPALLLSLHASLVRNCCFCCIPDSGPYVLAGAPWTGGLCHTVSFGVCLATNKTIWCFF